MGENNSSSAVLSFVIGIYMLISQIMTLVFFVDYCKADDSLLKIILVDPILAELKGLLWIFFV